MRIGELFPSDFINADAVGDREVHLTISHVEMVEMGNDGPKPALYFRETDNALPLNKTNASTLAEAYGDETEAWAGKPVKMFTRKVEFRGKMVPGVRLEATGTGETPTESEEGKLPF